MIATIEELNFGIAARREGRQGTGVAGGVACRRDQQLVELRTPVRLGLATLSAPPCVRKDACCQLIHGRIEIGNQTFERNHAETAGRVRKSVIT